MHCVPFFVVPCVSDVKWNIFLYYEPAARNTLTTQQNVRTACDILVSDDCCGRFAVAPMGLGWWRVLLQGFHSASPCCAPAYALVAPNGALCGHRCFWERMTVFFVGVWLLF